MAISQKKLADLKHFFSQKPEISMAFVFGSHAKGQPISESDVDIAVYFKPIGRELEWEEERDYNEDRLWVEIESIVGQDTDLVVLNRARSTLASEILRTGIPIIIKDRGLYLRFLLTISSAAEDFRKIIMDWWAIKERSRSLTEEDRLKLVNIADFLTTELEDSSEFTAINQSEYFSNPHKRRELERLVENIANASIDIAKTILASQKERLPDTYVKIMLSLGKLPGFDEKVAENLSNLAKLRNLLAHEYLDIRFAKIRKFLDSAADLYGYLLDFTKKFLEQENS